MDINTDINILGGMPDYNVIRIYIVGVAKDKSTSVLKSQHFYTGVCVKRKWL